MRSSDTVSSIRERVEQAPVRLRQPERLQMAMVVSCPDDLVSATHPVRLLDAVVQRLDLTQFYQPIQARQGVAGRDATDPRLVVALWLYACTCGIGSARELARRCSDSAPFRWLCGGVTVNHRLLSDFRTDHGAALDALFTQVIASLVDKDVVRVSRVSQDGVRVRVGAGAGSFRSAERLEKLLDEAREHVAALRAQVDSPEYKALTARQRAARKRAATERLERMEQAVAQLPELKRKQAAAEKRAGHGKQGEKVRAAPAARQHHRSAGAGDEDAQRRLQSRSQRAVGHRYREPRDSRRRGDPRRHGQRWLERADAPAGGGAQRRASRAASAGRRLSADGGHRTGPCRWRRTVHAAQDG